jgi:enamine deaminase RidA (YjgF/YER057c/UK114 family)
VIHPAGWKLPPAPYSYGIKSGNTLFLAGLVSRNGVDNAPVPGGIAAQTRMIMNAASVILKEAGMTLADVVSSRIFLPDMTMFQAMNAEYRTHFPTSPPARATVKAAPPGTGSIIEIAMIAVKHPMRTTIVPPNADGTPAAPSPILSPAIQVGKRLYVAGMLGNTPATKGNVQAQTAETLARLGRALKAAGYDWSQVVESTVFLPDMSRAAEMDATYRTVFAANPPVRLLMPTALVGADALVEIMLTAVK